MSAAPLDWGTERELTSIETMMWRADADPVMRSTMTVVELLDVEPEWSRLVAAHEWACRMVPRFRDRVTEPLGPFGTPVWSRAPHLDLHYHLRRVRLGGDGGLPELFTLAEQLAMTPFDRARPPWDAVLVEGLPGGKAAYLLKLHHALTDGLGMTHLLAQLHSRRREHTPDKPQPAVAEQADSNLVDELVRQLQRTVSAVPPALRGGAGLLASSLRSPWGQLRDGLRYVDSARRVLSPPATPGSPLLASRSASWRFVALDVPLADLKAAASACRGSLNDAYLAALLGGFRLYHEEMGAPLPSDAMVPLTVPVSVRRPGDAAGGNHIAPARLRAPVGLANPHTRMIMLRSSMIAARNEPALRSFELVTPLLARLPPSWLIRVAGSTTAGNDLQASNVPGVVEDMYLAGARIERIYPFAPLPGCAAMVTMYSYAGVCNIGANLDAAAITEPAVFAQCLERGFAEVFALHRRGGAVVSTEARPQIEPGIGPTSSVP